MVNKYVKCNLCGSDNYTVVFPSGVAQINQIVKCNTCGLMYANPRSQEEDCVQIKNYDTSWFISNLHDPYIKQRLQKEQLQVKDYQNTKNFINKNYPQKGTLLEIGSGFGYLLNFFKKDGWNVVGIEPNAGMCKFAESQLNITSFPKILEETEFEENSVDVILMMHVIEHLPDPMATLKKVYKILKPGGLFVLETPRYDTLMFKLLGKRERSLSCDGHIYFFTSEHLEKMVKNVEFNVLKSEYVGRSLTLDRLFYNFGVISKSSDFKQKLRTIGTKLNLDQISLYLNLRDMERIYLKK